MERNKRYQEEEGRKNASKFPKHMGPHISHRGAIGIRVGSYPLLTCEKLLAYYNIVCYVASAYI